jgi:hypothetical protein
VQRQTSGLNVVEPLLADAVDVAKRRSQVAAHNGMPDRKAAALYEYETPQASAAPGLALLEGICDNLVEIDLLLAAEHSV